MKVAGRPLSRWEDVSAVAECALALQQAVDSAGFERLGLSGLRGMRVAARAAAVFEGWDPIGGVTGLAVQPAEAPARPIARLQADRFETWTSRGRGGDHQPYLSPKTSSRSSVG